MMASDAENSPENGSTMAARVSMLTPGMAPNSSPPISPAKNMPMLVQLLNSVSAPAMNCSTAAYPIGGLTKTTNQLPNS